LDIDSLRQYSASLLDDLRQMFVKLTPESITQAKQCARTGRDAELIEHAHTMKNYGMGVFATQFSALCRELEAVSRRKDRARINELLAELEPAFDDAVQALEQISTVREPDAE
jgi:HPt (histidine-containing phosphotransfer) domain-containing protein